MSELWRVVIKGWQERIGDLPGRPVGWLAAQTVPSPFRLGHVLTRLERLRGKVADDASPEVVRRHELGQLRRMAADSLWKLQASLHLPALTHQQQRLAFQGIQQTYIWLAGLVAHTSKAAPYLWLRQHMVILGPHEDGGIELLADLGALPLVSAIFGVSTRWLRPCRRGPHLFTPMRRDAFRQQTCDACRDTHARGVYARDLPNWAVPCWSRVRHRMYVRLHYEYRRSPQKAGPAYKAWYQGALDDLRRRTAHRTRGQSIEQVLDDWEHEYARRLSPGRRSKKQ